MSLLSFAQKSIDPSFVATTTTSSGVSSVGAPELFIILPFILIWLAVVVLLIVSLWKIFEKTGRPGWASIVPVYNSWVLLEIVGYPGWWALLSLVPLVNLFPAVMMIIAYYKLAKLFGKSDGFAVCTIFFPIITLPILAFGSSTFQNVSASPEVLAPQVPQAPTVVGLAAPQAPQAPAAPEAPQTQEQPPMPPQNPLIQ